MTNYFSNIIDINDFLKEELRDTIIIPVLTNDIAFKSGNDYSNFAYISGKDYYSNFILNDETDYSKYLKELTEATDAKNKAFAKSKLKHSILKNMLYNNNIKTRQDAEYYFKTLNEAEYVLNDKIAYYLDFVNEYNLLTDVIDNSVKDTNATKAIKAKNAAYALKTDISKPKNDTDLLLLATDTYFGPVILTKYNLLDIVVLCCIIILAILIYFLKYFINIYLTGIILLMFILCLVFLTVIFI